MHACCFLSWLYFFVFKAHVCTLQMDWDSLNPFMDSSSHSGLSLPVSHLFFISYSSILSPITKTRLLWLLERRCSSKPFSQRSHITHRFPKMHGDLITFPVIVYSSKPGHRFYQIISEIKALGRRTNSLISVCFWFKIAQWILSVV